jgi:hypothetical protein
LSPSELRYKDAKALALVFQAAWLKEPSLPDLSEIFDEYKSPVITNAMIPQVLRATGNVNDVQVETINLYTQFILSLLHTHNVRKRPIGNTFANLPGESAQRYATNNLLTSKASVDRANYGHF